MNRNELQIIIDAQDRASKVLGRVRGQIDQTADRVRSLETTFQGIRNAGAIAFTSTAGLMGLAVREASDLKESINAVDVVFGEAGEKLHEFGKTASTSVGLTASAFNQAAVPIGAMLKNVGYQADEAADGAINLTKRAADMASVFNTSVDDALEAIASGLRGEADPLERYGVGLSAVAIESYAVREGIVSANEALTDQQKAAARMGLLLEQTSDLQGDFVNTSDGLANMQRVLGAEIKTTAGQLGALFIPMIENALQKIKPVIESVGQWIDKNPELAKNIIIATVAISGLLVGVGALGLVLPAIIAGFSALLSPVTLIAGVIGGLLAVAVAQSNITLEDFGKWIQLGKEKAIQLKDRIVELYNRIIESPAFQLIVDQMRQIWFVITNEIIPVFVNFIKNLEPLKPVLLFLAKLFGTILVASLIGLTSAITGVVTVIGKVLTWSQELAEYLIGGFSEALLNIQEGWQTVKEAIEPVIEKLKEVYRWARKAARYLNPVTAAKGVYNAGKSVFGRANGGLVNAGQTYRVGERGPEMFTPQKSGRIVPNGGGLTVNITGNTFMGREDIAEQIGNDLLQVMKRENRI